MELTKDNKAATIMSDCDSVHVLSTRSLMKSDHVIVGDIVYKEEKSQINQVVLTNFTISMESDSSIALSFNCTEWGAWKAFDNDGNCRTAKLRPLHNWKKTKGNLKYKFNETCSKLAAVILIRFRRIDIIVDLNVIFSRSFWEDRIA